VSGGFRIDYPISWNTLKDKYTSVQSIDSMTRRGIQYSQNPYLPRTLISVRVMRNPNLQITDDKVTNCRHYVTLFDLSDTPYPDYTSAVAPDNIAVNNSASAGSLKPTNKA
jgi:hypothetical protein